eukprot:CAMPEP_0201513256 /NCGR_PEP_ID=MMETSP0161_2-20130828/5341_1 /ASSEMBLY_ACC=CAM_ASM_000251 /TAXON_ID=180227 /ORGANISM="Neoparamoeba aestuarina, Strain SoJaBio B1-5/56/2" /LENGTH=522 /DNA_ID=CAMNT_0047909395 /DNA_START=97 /DNA_END=1661 /DNA_ORIENTATION=+
MDNWLDSPPRSYHEVFLSDPEEALCSDQSPVDGIFNPFSSFGSPAHGDEFMLSSSGNFGSSFSDPSPPSPSSPSSLSSPTSPSVSSPSSPSSLSSPSSPVSSPPPALPVSPPHNPPHFAFNANDVSHLSQHLNSNAFVKSERTEGSDMLTPFPSSPNNYHSPAISSSGDLKQETYDSPQSPVPQNSLLFTATSSSSSSSDSSGKMTAAQKRAARKTKRSQRVAAVRASRIELETVEEESPEEQARKKKERRMIRNRESALQSRLRKKKELDDAVAKADDLEKRNHELVLRNQQLLQENEHLKNTICRLQNASSSYGFGSASGPLPAAGVVTFVFLFAFGFGFGVFQFGASSSVVVPFAPTGRTLKELGPLSPEPSSAGSLVKHPSPTSYYALENYDNGRQFSSFSLLSFDEPDKGMAEREKRRDSCPKIPADEKEIVEKKGLVWGGGNGTSGLPAVVISEEMMEFEEDTLYFFCTDGERMIVPGEEDAAGKKMKVSVVIPSWFLNVSHEGEEMVVGGEREWG